MGEHLEATAGTPSGWFIDSQICTVEVEAYCYTNGSMNIATINS